MSKKWLGVIVGLIVIGCATWFSYTYLRSNGESPKVMTIKDISVVEPGLGLRTLHKQGYTGKGINVAIIDGPLLQEHDEYSDRLVHFEKVGIVDDNYLYHGTTVASVLVGKKCGVLPEAHLHYFAVNAMDERNVLRALERVLSYNDTLKESERIRFINISTGLSENEAVFRDLIYEARDKGIIVFSSTMPTVTDPPFALREAAYDDRKDMNNLNNIIIGDWMNAFLSDSNMSRADLVRIRKEADGEDGYINVYLPCARRYVASTEANDKYIYDFDGGLSWATPMLTGLAAMVSQVNPCLSNDDVLRLLADSIVANEKGLNIIDPELLVTLARVTIE